MSPAMLRQLLATTISNYRSQLYDNITGSNLILATLEKKGRITSIDGGADIRGPVIFDEEEFKWYDGMDSLGRVQKETIGEAIYSPGMAAASITLSGEEMAKNNGKSQIVKLMRGKTQNAENTLKSGITRAIYGDGTLAKSFVGLDAIVSDTPAVGTVGGIDAAAKAWWRNKAVTVAMAGAADDAERYRRLRKGMSALYRACAVGTEKPDVITLEDDVYGVFEGGLQENQRYADANAAALGFDTLKFRQASVITESAGSAHPADHGFFINTDFLGLEYYEGRGFDELDLPESTPDVDAVTKHIGFMGAMTCYKRNRHGRLIVTGL
ncbi:phage major capsid protein [Aureimonas fodinaquatilis]|uniref:Phage major capsid protein n=1 Tax=Aureimonas fodinaquatilis TaxID=2565783 RepID=A0A5B0DZA3_9HYPH|nr:phage major capsid protein [Aureimonas fodinaquatilis]KAA0971081.1 phage major capsid protein [Aureimonas fodinaquatilis]